MSNTSLRSDWSRRAAGIFTLLVTVVLILTSYAAASDLMRSPDPGDGGKNDQQPVFTAVKTPVSTVQPLHPTAADTGGIPETHTANDSMTETNGASSLPATQSASGMGDRNTDDGYIAEGETLSPFDDYPAIRNLDPDLRTAIQNASIDAKADGVEMVINSGWRSERYQQSLLDEAIVTYGSEEEARKWVNTPEKSTHVTGDAVDVGYTDADYWLIQHGNEYGLCQIYANEIWHFELAVNPGEACPAPRTDALAG